MCFCVTDCIDLYSETHDLYKIALITNYISAHSVEI